MAKKSVTAQVKELATQQLDSRSEKIQEASDILANAEAIADLRAFSSVGDMQQFTLQTIALHQWQMIGEARNLLDEALRG